MTLRRNVPLVRKSWLRRWNAERGVVDRSQPLKRTPIRQRGEDAAELEALTKLFTAYVVLRDGGCVYGIAEVRTIGHSTCRGPLQGAHIKSKGKYRSMRFALENIICMCRHHHMDWWHGNDPDEVKEWCDRWIPHVMTKVLLMARTLQPGGQDLEATRLYVIQETARLRRLPAGTACSIRET